MLVSFDINTIVTSMYIQYDSIFSLYFGGVSCLFACLIAFLMTLPLIYICLTLLKNEITLQAFCSRLISGEMSTVWINVKLFS